ESLTLLGAVLTIGADAPWARPILEKLRAEAAAAPEPPAPVQNEPPDPTRVESFADALALLWPRSDWVTRRHLATIATALGIAVPADALPVVEAPPVPAEADPV